jgi:HlyD family secretion protein
VVDLPVQEGDRVQAGQLLAQLDPVPARSDFEAAQAQVRAIQADARAGQDQIASAQADLAAARAREKEASLVLERARALAGDGVVAPAELDRAEAAADSARAQVEAARATLDRAESALEATRRRVAQARAQAERARDLLQKTSIVAPIDGVVSRLQVREGEMVVIGLQNQPGTTLMTISDLSGIHAEVKVAEADVLQLALGQSAEVTLEALPGRSFAGQVIEIGASALPQAGAVVAAREFRVVIRLAEPDAALRPGLTCDAEILTGELRGVTTLPLQAVVLRPPPGAAGEEDGGQGTGQGEEVRGVFVVEDGEARFVPVETGLIGGLDVEVRGLPAGTEVVAGPYQVLRDLQGGEAARPRRKD